MLAGAALKHIAAMCLTSKPCTHLQLLSAVVPPPWPVLGTAAGPCSGLVLHHHCPPHCRCHPVLHCLRSYHPCPLLQLIVWLHLPAGQVCVNCQLHAPAKQMTYTC